MLRVHPPTVEKKKVRGQKLIFIFINSGFSDNILTAYTISLRVMLFVVSCFQIYEAFVAAALLTASRKFSGKSVRRKLKKY